MNIEALIEKRNKLNAAIDKIEVLCDDCEALDGLYEMLSEVCEQIEVWESEAPKREAYARLQYHADNDTLDLY